MENDSQARSCTVAGRGSKDLIRKAIVLKLWILGRWAKRQRVWSFWIVKHHFRCFSCNHNQMHLVLNMSNFIFLFSKSMYCKSNTYIRRIHYMSYAFGVHFSVTVGQNCNFWYLIKDFNFGILFYRCCKIKMIYRYREDFWKYHSLYNLYGSR